MNRGSRPARHQGQPTGCRHRIGAGHQAGAGRAHKRRTDRRSAKCRLNRAGGEPGPCADADRRQSAHTNRAAARWVDRCGQGSQATEQAGSKLLEHADKVLFDLGHAVLLFEHPAAQRAGQRGHVRSHGRDHACCSGGIGGRIHANLRWVGYARGCCRHYRSPPSGGSPVLTTLACTR